MRVKIVATNAQGITARDIAESASRFHDLVQRQLQEIENEGAHVRFVSQSGDIGIGTVICLIFFE